MSTYKRSDGPLQPQPGSTLDPRNAVGRTNVTARAHRELRAGNNLALTDPRRMGKTVWLDICAATPAQDLTFVKVDYEGVTTAAAFLLRPVTALRGHGSLPARARDRFLAIFEGWEAELGAGPITVRPGVAMRPPIEVLSDLLGSVDENLPKGEFLVVLMDEVPIAIKNIAAKEGPDVAHTLLQALRELRTREASRLRWIVCGSIGFHHVLRSCGATEGAVNDLMNLPLGPLEKEEARELADRLLRGIERDGHALGSSALVDRAGAIPFLIHALAQRLRDTAQGPAGPDQIKDAFLDFVEDRDSSRAVTHLLTRLEPHYSERTPVAEAILDRLALEGPVSALEFGDQIALVNDLVDDHYLREHRQQLAWRYDVLRDIWMQRRKLG